MLDFLRIETMPFMHFLSQKTHEHFHACSWVVLVGLLVLIRHGDGLNNEECWENHRWKGTRPKWSPSAQATGRLKEKYPIYRGDLWWIDLPIFVGSPLSSWKILVIINIWKPNLTERKWERWYFRLIYNYKGKPSWYMLLGSFPLSMALASGWVVEGGWQEL